MLADPIASTPPLPEGVKTAPAVQAAATSKAEASDGEPPGAWTEELYSMLFGSDEGSDDGRDEHGDDGSLFGGPFTVPPWEGEEEPTEVS